MVRRKDRGGVPMPDVSPVLVAGAGETWERSVGQVELLRNREVPVRAFVHREDERAEALRAAGAEGRGGGSHRGT
jgi:hypothetical protein